MKLPQAIRKSAHRAAILSLPHRLWNYVVVEWGPHAYTTEIHQYNTGGILDFQIISYRHVNEQELRIQVGEEYYFSLEWEPYATPTAEARIQHKIKIQKERQKQRPPQVKQIRKGLDNRDWEEILRSIYNE